VIVNLIGLLLISLHKRSKDARSINLIVLVRLREDNFHVSPMQAETERDLGILKRV
jgi:hypothetical protein